MKNVSVALIHYPVYNKNKEIVATSITNLDIHDIARCAKTYGLDKYFIVHPGKAEQDFAKQMTGFWNQGYGKTYNPDRSQALGMVEVISEIAQIREHYQNPVFAATTAKKRQDATDIHTLAQKASQDQDRQYVLLFGTGWGLAEDVIINADYVLKPLTGAAEYNHLSVRSAAAIIFDRINNYY